MSKTATPERNLYPMRIAIYMHCSNGPQNSAEMKLQERNCRKAAARFGWVVQEQFVICDTTKSGVGAANRPSYQQLMNAAAKTPRPFDTVLISDLNSLADNFVEFLELTDVLTSYGVRVYAADGQLDSWSPTCPKLLPLSNFDLQQTALLKPGVQHVVRTIMFP